MVSSRCLFFLGCMFLVSACSGGKAEVDEDFSDLAQMDQKSDAFSYRLKLLGTVASGETMALLYTKIPRFRGFELTGSEGDQVDVWVRGPRGDALTWLLDSRFNVVAKNDDADESTLDSHIVATLPASTTGRYYIVLRDYYLESRRFEVELNTTPVQNPGSPHDPLIDQWLGYSAANGGLFGEPRSAEDLSEAGRAKYMEYVERFPSATVSAYEFPNDNGEGATAVVGCLEEFGWVDLFQAGGVFVVHGATRTGCSTPSWEWQPTEWDPSL